MAKYTITCECGHEYTFSLTGPHKNREWYLDKAKDNVCPDCKAAAKKAAIELENKVAAEKSAEMELPELEGSPKQIAWANTLRMSVVETIEKLTGKIKPEFAEMFMAFYSMITSETSAKFFIETRDKSVKEMFKEYYEEHKDDDRTVEIKEETTETVKTESSEKPGAVEIKIENGEISAIYSKDNDMIEACRAAGFKWNSEKWCWARKITKLNGGADRAVELGHALLKAGFAVKSDKELTARMISGEYESECTHWVDFEDGNVIIHCGYDKDYWEESNKIHGARYKRGIITAPVSSYSEIRDFAEINGFKITEEAEIAMNAAEDERNNITTVIVSEHEEEEKMTREEMLSAKMASDEIISDLLDEDEKTDIDRINELGYSVIPGRTIGEKIVSDPQGCAVSVCCPDGSLKTIEAVYFDKEASFGGIKIKVSELVKFAYGYDDKKLTEVGRKLTDEQYENFCLMNKEIGYIECDIKNDAKIPDEFTQVDTDHYVSGNTGMWVASGQDEWALWFMRFDHSPSVDEIDAAVDIELQKGEAMMRYRA